MGRRGPAPKPTALRLLHGETKPSRVSRTEPVPRNLLPVMPDYLPERAQQIWADTVSELVHMRLVTAADGVPLAVYCMAVQHHEDACRLLNTAGFLVAGRKGETVKNPAAMFVRDQAFLVAKMAAQFGLTPAARVGLVAGDVEANAAGAERLLS